MDKGVAMSVGESDLYAEIDPLRIIECWVHSVKKERHTKIQL